MTNALTRPTRGSTSITGILIKVVLLGGIDALALFALFTLFMQQSFVVFGIALVVLIAINYIYL